MPQNALERLAAKQNGKRLKGNALERLAAQRDEELVPDSAEQAKQQFMEQAGRFVQPTVEPTTFGETWPAKILRGAALGAFEGAGIPETQTPVRDLFKGLAQPKPLSNIELLDPTGGQVRAVVGIAKNLYGAGKEFVSGVRERDPEAAAHGLTSGVVQALMLKGITKAGKLRPVSESPVVQTVQASGRAAREATTEALTGGRVTIEEAVTARNAEAAAAKAKYETSVGEVTTKRAETVIQNELNWADATQKYDQAVATRETAIQSQQAQVAQRLGLEKAIETNAIELGKNLTFVEKNIRIQLGARYSAIRDAVGTETISFKPVQEAVKHAQKEILQGSPESIKAFRSILEGGEPELGLADASVFRGAGFAGRRAGIGFNEAGVPQTRMADFLESMPPELRAQAEAQMGISVKGGQMPYRDAHGYFSELGEQMARGNLPGDVYRAIKHVRESIFEQMKGAARKAGVEEQLLSTNKEWHEFMDAFHDMSPVAQGGSPVARILRAVDPGYIAGPLLAKAGERAIRMLETYQPYGVQPEVAKAIRFMRQQADALPSKVKDIPMPKAPIRKDKALSELPKEPEAVAPIKVSELRGKKLQQLSERLKTGITGWEVASLGYALHEIMRGQFPYALGYPIGRRAIGMALATRPAQRIIAKPTRRDIRIEGKQ